MAELVARHARTIVELTFDGPAPPLRIDSADIDGETIRFPSTQPAADAARLLSSLGSDAGRLRVLALARSILQLNAVSNLGTMLFAGLGGAIAPIAVLPGWARAVAPATPSYWAMRGFRDVIAGGGFAEVAIPITVLLGFATTFAIVAGLRFRFDDVKVSFA